MQCVAPWKGKIKLMDSFEDAWKVISDYCKSKITDIAYNTWISRIQPVDLDFDNGTAYLLVPNDFHAQTLRRCYMSLLNEGFEEIFGTKFNIEFRTPANAPKKSKPSAAASITTSAATAPLLQSPDSSSYEYTFDTFIVGSSNKFAHAACLAVATNPSHAYNPLFLYGNSGLGKTHLLYAIGNEIKKNDPSKVICYIKGDDFTVELVESLRLAKMNEFRQKYRQADILLVDDVQFIGGKESTQEEFFHTFNALYDARKQIVLTSDRPPKEIKTLEDRLRSRFEQDLIADIQPPDLETRIAIIKRKAELDGVEISDEVCEYVASKIKANIRQLEGTVKKIKAKYYLDGEKPTINSVQGIISDILNNDAPPEVTVERIIDEVARTYGVSADEIRSQKNRSANISNARHIAIYVTRELTTLSMVAIGEEFGNRHYSTIIYTIQKVQKMMEKDRKVKEIIDDTIKNIRDILTSPTTTTIKILIKRQERMHPMKISCLRSDLATAISNVSRAVSTKASIPALEGVLIKAYGNTLNISGYNLEIGITTDIEATIKEEGEIVVSAKLFLDIVRRLPEEIVFIETDERMVTYIACGKVNYQIVGMSSVEYPDLPSFEQTDRITLNAKILRDMIRQTVYAVSENTAKPIYTGSLYEIEDGVFKIIAIDGYRMAIRSENVDSESKNRFVVPGKTQHEVLKLLTDDEENTEIIIGQRHITFKIKNYRIISRLIEGTFIEYKSAIPKETKTEVVINTRTIIDAVERMSLLNNDRIQSPVRCIFSDDEIKLSCTSAVGRANDVISVPIIGESVEIGFNNRYLLDALKNADTDEIKLILNGSLTAMIVKPVKGDSYLSIVVPMRLANEN